MCPPEHVEVEEGKGKQARKEIAEEATQKTRSRKGEEEEDYMPDDKDVWSRRPVGTAIDRVKIILYSLELTRTTDERADFEERGMKRVSEMSWMHQYDVHVCRAAERRWRELKEWSK